MSGKRNAGIAAAGGVAVAAVIGIFHGAGSLVDDAARLGGRGPDPRPPVVAPKVPHVPPAVVDALDDPAVADSVKQGITAFRNLRNGDDAEKELVRVACAGFDAFASQQGSQQAYETYIWQNVPSFVPESVVGKYVSTLATGMYAAEINGGLTRWYVQYCAFPSK